MSPIGVSQTAPWPIATETVSPSYHFSPKVFFFHAVDGTSPPFSPGRSIPVGLVTPMRLAISWMLSTPVFNPVL